MKKFFILPNNSVGKSFVSELSHQLQLYTDSAGTNASALYNFTVLPSLMLQIPTSFGCSYKEATSHLRCRLALWADQNLTALVDEGRSLQKQFRTQMPGGRLQGEHDQARKFGQCMSTGHVHEALRMLSEKQTSDAGLDVLLLDEVITDKDGTTASVRDLLDEKHPRAQRASEKILIGGDLPTVNPIRFEALTAELLRRVALQARGSAGPSGLNSDAWRRMCSSYKGASSQLCHSLANLARLLASQKLYPGALTPFLSCRLIALNKKPGVRPIGICETARRIVFKAILHVVGEDVEEACGEIQKCSGFPAGLESAVHAMQMFLMMR